MWNICRRLSPITTTSFHIYFSTRLDFPLPTLSAPGSPRMEFIRNLTHFLSYSASVILLLPKIFTRPSGKLSTEFTSPIAKSTSPRLSDTTFFARWTNCPILYLPVSCHLMGLCGTSEVISWPPPSVRIFQSQKPLLALAERPLVLPSRRNTVELCHTGSLSSEG